MKKVLVAAAVLTAVVSTIAGAQERNIPYVDIAAANAEIEQLQTNNQERAAQNSELEAENEELQAQIAADQQEVTEIEPILDRVDAELTDLFAVNRTIVDEDMKDRSQEAIGRARSIKSNLENQLRVLSARIEGNREQVTENRERMRINTRNIGRNEERVLFLEAAIRQTEAQQQRLDTFITNVDSILSDAEQYVDSSAEGDGTGE